MLLSIFANLGIIILNIYLIFRLNNGMEARGYSQAYKVILFILLETVIGILLMQFSYVLLNIRIDFRFLLYTLAFKYLGWKISVPTIFLVAIGRFFFSYNQAAWINLAAALFLMATMPLLLRFLKRHFGDLGQLLILQVYSIGVSLVPSGILFDEITEIIYINILLLILSSLLIIVLYSVYEDVEKVFSLVNKDELTQLGNVRKFQRDVGQFETQGKRCSMIMLDIDHFKRYNDTYGHHVGDIVLKEVAQVFLKLSLPYAQFYRIGSEEFVVLMPDNANQSAYDFAQEIHLELQKLRIDHGMAEKLTVTVSMGVARQGALEESTRTLARADGALYTAKQSGRNQIVLA